MKITWLGHASFLIETEDINIVTDPFEKKVGYPIYAGRADIATVSHDHYDHNAVGLLKGKPRIVRETGLYEINGVRITGTATWHDKRQGRERGPNIIYKIETEDIALLHLGDLGHVLTPEQAAAVGNVDILLLPVGGRYTVDAGEAFIIAGLLQPRIIIPMHYKTPPCTVMVGPVESFTMKFDRVVKLPYLLVNKEELDSKSGVVLLDYPG